MLCLAQKKAAQQTWRFSKFLICTVDTNFTAMRPGISELRVIELWKVPRDVGRFFARYRDLDDVKQPAILT